MTQIKPDNHHIVYIKRNIKDLEYTQIDQQLSQLMIPGNRSKNNLTSNTHKEITWVTHLAVW